MDYIKRRTLIIILLIVGVTVILSGAYYASHFTIKAGGNTVVDVPGASGPFSCYVKNEFGVYFSRGLYATDILNSSSSYSEKVTGADPSSFRQVSSEWPCFGVDSKAIYIGTSSIPVLWQTNPATFEILWKVSDTFFLRTHNGITKYTHDKPSNILADRFEPVPNGDPSTFEEIQSIFDKNRWAKDKNNVYCDGYVVSGANPSTATTTKEGYSVEVQGVVKVFGYYDNLCPPQIRIRVGDYLKDDKYVYYNFISPTVIPDADPDTFQLAGSSYVAKDKNQVYQYGTILKEADPATFVSVVEWFYWKDTSHVWVSPPTTATGYLQLIPEADAASFRYLGYGNEAEDDHYRYSISSKGHFGSYKK